jgi:hypothetical protein
MNESQAPSFRHAVMAVAVTFLGAGLPDGLRGFARRAAGRVLSHLDNRRLRFDP